MSESVHKFVHEGYGTKVKITTQDVSLSGILETFTHYLKACGFSMDGRSVEAVLDEPEEVPYSPPSVRDAISLLEDVETPDSLSDYNQEMLLDEVSRIFNGNDEHNTHRLLAAMLSHCSSSLEAVVKLREDLRVIINSWPSDEKAESERLTEEDLEGGEENYPAIRAAIKEMETIDALKENENVSSMLLAPEEITLTVKDFLANRRDQYRTEKTSSLLSPDLISPIDSFVASPTAFPTDLAFSPPEGMHINPDAILLTDECPLTWNEFRLTEEELEAKKTKSISDNFFSPQCKL